MSKKNLHIRAFIGILFWCMALAGYADTFYPLNVERRIDAVQPFTGIVLWNDNPYCETYRDAIQLEYAYVPYSDIVKEEAVYEWMAIEQILEDIASRGHQAILRFYFVYPEDLPDRDGTTAVPRYIKNRSDYNEFKGKGDGASLCWFPDWRNTELQRFVLEFYTKFAERYDTDKRIAFIQTGFGLWAEYHNSDSEITLDGITYRDKEMVGLAFPSKEYQGQFINHLNNCFRETPWSISIDAADSAYTPLSENPAMKDINFGLFDDSFMSEEHDQWNKWNWEFFGLRYKTAPAGGEFNYYTNYDQQNVLNPAGLRGRTWEQWAKQYHISYMIGNDQADYQPGRRIKEASMFAGYKFKLEECRISETQTRLKFSNVGIAPLYFDAYPEIKGIRSLNSLKGLLPGESRDFILDVTTTDPDEIRIACDRLLPSQQIQFTTSDIVYREVQDEFVEIIRNWIILKESSDARVYNLQGTLLESQHSVDYLNLNMYPSGVYLIYIRSHNGHIFKKKLMKW